MAKVLAIPKWFDLQCGHELPAKQGYYIKRALDYFISHIHPGNGRRELKRRFGLDDEHACASVYDRLCQLAANQVLERRGKLYDPLGSPYTVAGLASMFDCPIDWLDDKLDKLQQVGWVAWFTEKDSIPEHPLLRKKSADGGKIPPVSEKQSALTEPETITVTEPYPKPETVTEPRAAAGLPNGNPDAARTLALSLKAVRCAMLGLGADEGFVRYTLETCKADRARVLEICRDVKSRKNVAKPAAMLRCELERAGLIQRREPNGR